MVNAVETTPPEQNSKKPATPVPDIVLSSRALPAGLDDGLAPDVVDLLEVHGISLTLGSRVVLDNVGFTVATGEIFGLLGPNGSGKTSLIRCLAGLIDPDLGVLKFDGKDMSFKRRLARAHIGVVFQDPSLDGHLTARENLVLMGRLFGVKNAEAEKRAGELLAFMDLAPRANDPVRTFSGGMRRRLEIARALIHSPRLLVLDEPTSGLDLDVREKTWQLLSTLRKLQGLSVVVSTHDADEAARCDRLLILDRGHVVTVESPAELLGRMAGDILSITADKPQELAETLHREFGWFPTLIDDTIEVTLMKAHEIIPRLVEGLPKGRLRSLSIRKPSLGDAFMKITGRRLNSEDVAVLPEVSPTAKQAKDVS